ncbi:MAG: hypothetical protein HY741_00555 [Chloroflexi bacterium]|nr:hypothetical protein [Chloroflexota bacterium]
MDTLRAIETTATVDDERHLVLDQPLPANMVRHVRVIILLADDSEIEEGEWLRAAASSPSLAFLNDAREDIYTVSDGKPFHDRG